VKTLFRKYSSSTADRLRALLLVFVGGRLLHVAILTA